MGVRVSVPVWVCVWGGGRGREREEEEESEWGLRYSMCVLYHTWLERYLE